MRTSILISMLTLALGLIFTNQVHGSSAKRIPVGKCPSGGGTSFEKVETREFKPKAAWTFQAPATTKFIEVTEERRDLRIVKELREVARAVAKADSAPTRSDELCGSYTASMKRSTITVRALGDGDVELEKVVIIFGPEEGGYLSADIPIGDIKQLKYDTATNTVVERGTPSSIYLGINYKPFGDVYSEYEVTDYKNNFAVKLMFKASSKPGNSYGVGLAYSFDIAEVFVARIRTKSDPSIPETTRGYKDSTVVGVSFNVSKGIDWLTKK